MATRPLLPQYSIRWLLALTAACAVIFSIFAVAVQEYQTGYRDGCWASGVAIGIVSLVGVMLIHALVFAAVWAFGEIRSRASRRRTGAGQSPFAPAASPPKPDPLGPAHSATHPDEPATPIILD